MPLSNIKNLVHVCRLIKNGNSKNRRDEKEQSIDIIYGLKIFYISKYYNYADILQMENPDYTCAKYIIFITVIV